MKRLLMISVMLSSLVSVGVAEETWYKYGVGAKVWYNTKDSFLSVGPMLNIDLKKNYFISAMGVFSDAHRNVEIIFGKAFCWLDVGVGFNYSQLKEYDLSVYGPSIYTATGNLFANGPLGWYLQLSFVPVEFGDIYDSKPYFYGEGGMYYSLDRWMATLGYRYYASFDDSELDSGVIASSVVFRF